ncbi:hypothetical protein LTR04_007229, partial [Oleoguttula sp. CCFEE 6159]
MGSFATARDGRPTIGERTASAPTGRQHAEGLPIITEEEDEVETPSSHPSTDRPVIDHMPMEEIAPESEQQQRSSSEPIEPAHYSYILDLTTNLDTKFLSSNTIELRTTRTFNFVKDTALGFILQDKRL